MVVKLELELNGIVPYTVDIDVSRIQYNSSTPTNLSIHRSLGGIENINIIPKSHTNVVNVVLLLLSHFGGVFRSRAAFNSNCSHFLSVTKCATSNNCK